jgi:hypothetical protein
MKSADYFVVLLLLGVVFALLISAPFFEAMDNTLINAGGAAFDGDPPPCRPDRLGVVLTLKGTPSVCQATRNGYEWTPTGAPAQPARAVPPVPAGLPRTATAYQPCTRPQHGWRTGDGLMICVESGKQPGVFYWFPY